MALPQSEDIKKILETFYKNDNKFPSLTQLQTQLREASMRLKLAKASTES